MQTGEDYRHRWLDEIRTIHEYGPFSPQEIKALSMLQIQDYYYVTSWILRQEGEAAFVSGREELRGLLLRRLARGERLSPQ